MNSFVVNLFEILQFLPCQIVKVNKNGPLKNDCKTLNGNSQISKKSTNRTWSLKVFMYLSSTLIPSLCAKSKQIVQFLKLIGPVAVHALNYVQLVYSTLVIDNQKGYPWLGVFQMILICLRPHLCLNNFETFICEIY